MSAAPPITEATTACPSCQARLTPEPAAPSRPILCATCGTQFRLDASWPERRTSRKATASFVLGILSPAGMFVTGIPALLLGAQALGDIHRAPQTLTGKRRAAAGAILGAVFSFAIFLVPIVVAAFFADKIRSSTQPTPNLASRPAPVIPRGAEIVVAPGAAWRWFHPLDGADPHALDAGFHRPGYDDSAWPEAAESPAARGFGYGDPVDVDIGTPPSGFRHSAWFRHRFATRDPYDRLLLTLFRDDGAVVYLDGKEVARDNMPVGSTRFDTVAVDTIGGPDESAVIGIDLPGLSPGDHVLAISLHNASNTSSDLRIGNITLYGISDDPLPIID